MTVKQKNAIEGARNILYIVLTSSVIMSGMFSIGWTYVVKPKVSEEVEIQLKPINETLEYQNLLLMSALTEEQLEWANTRYVIMNGGKQ